MEKIKLEWHTEKRVINELITYANNPRTLSEKQRKELEKSIIKFNLAEIPAINTDNTILAGHARLNALAALGRSTETIDVRVPNRTLTEDECKEYLLRSNKNTGSWDQELLRTFDIKLLLEIGFDETDLGDIWDDVLELEDDDFDEEEEVEKAKTTDIKMGDTFQLGKHYLTCGDSRDTKTVEKLVGENKINMVYCDPPYNIDLDYDKGVGGNKSYGGNVNDKMIDIDYEQFLFDTLDSAIDASSGDLHIFYWCDQKYVGLLQDLYGGCGIDYKRTCLWIKNGFSPTPKIAFNKGYEPCVYGTIGKPFLSNKHMKFNEVLNTEVGTGNATLDDIESILDIWLVKRIPGDEYEHPTQKPITLHERPILRCTKIGDCILDLFGGSGSTLLACEQLKRKAFLVEKDPIFCQLIINRYEKFTGEKAVKI